MIDLSGYFQSRWNAVAGFPERFNLPNCRNLIIVKRQAGGQTLYTQITPKPMIQTISPSMLKAYEGIDSIQVEVTDLQLHVSRSYPIDQLVGRGISYLIDGVMVGGVPSGGLEADKVPGTLITQNDLSWELLLRRRP